MFLLNILNSGPLGHGAVDCVRNVANSFFCSNDLPLYMLSIPPKCLHIAKKIAENKSTSYEWLNLIQVLFAHVLSL